jgi:hypothetical protein
MYSTRAGKKVSQPGEGLPGEGTAEFTPSVIVSIEAISQVALIDVFELGFGRIATALSIRGS